MDINKVKEIQELTEQTAELLLNLKPKTGDEWDAMEKLQAAHKQLRSIDITELVEKEPRAPFTK
jgi:hypothetical protein